jgi:polysaccharide chain length determinant protein (PEP-CTERM system associated)
MINSKKSYSIDEYIEILLRRIWYVVIPFLIIIFGVTCYVIFAPRQYKASTLIIVSPQRVPEAYIQATVTSKIEERLHAIADEVMSRTRLEGIINELHLYEKQKKRLSNEEVVALMRANIKVELPTKKEEKGSFAISFISSDANVATTVTNRLASLFIEENLKIREQQAVGTTEFLSNEVAMAKEKLDQMDKAVAEYKMRFMGQLPQQLDTNLKMLEQLQNQYQRVGESLRAAQDRKLFIQKQLNDLETPIRSGVASKTSPLREEDSTTARSSHATDLNGQLEDLQSKYRENHPDVVATKKKLADLEKKRDKDGFSSILKRDPRYQELKSQLMLTDLEINRFRAEESNIAGQISKLRSRIEQTPAREQDMASLMREYESTKEAYEKLSKKNVDAQQAENLEKRQKGEQFRVVDPAKKPEKPFSPDILRILLIGLGAGIGGGLAVAYLREQMDQSFHDVGDVETSLGLKVLAAIPRMGEELT